MAPVLMISLLGPVKVEVGGESVSIAPKPALLLARLALVAPRSVPTATLLDALWVGDPPATAHKSVHRYVWALRKVLPDGVLVAEGSGYALRCTTDEIDSLHLERLLQRAREARASDRLADAADLLTEALALYRGLPLDGLDEVDFVAEEARRLEEIRLATLELVAELDVSLGRFDLAIERISPVVQMYPLRERARATSMKALYHQGRHADALAEFQHYRTQLGEELGLEPSPEMVDLERRILLHDSSLSPSTRRMRSVGPDLESGRVITSVGVLPFQDLSEAGDQRYFCDGLSQELTHVLAAIPGVSVASRQSAFAFRGSDLDSRQIGAELGVGAIIEGSVRRQGDRVRISVEFSETERGFQIWSETFDGVVDDVFDMQRTIAASVAGELSGLVSLPDDRETLTTTRADAYDLYLRGRHQLAIGGPSATRRAAELFRAALRAWEGYALARAGLSDALTFLHLYYEPDRVPMDAALEESQRAVRLEPGLPEVHAARGFALGAAGRYEESLEEFETATDLPGDLYEAHYLWGRTLIAAGDLVGSRDRFAEATRWRIGDFHTLSLYAKALRGSGEDAASEGVSARALQLIERHLSLVPDDGRALVDGACCLVEVGRVEEGVAMARRSLRDEVEPVAYYAMCALARAGRRAEALAALESVVSSGWAHGDWLLNDPDCDTLRDEPGFAEIQARLS